MGESTKQQQQQTTSTTPWAPAAGAFPGTQLGQSLLGQPSNGGIVPPQFGQPQFGQPQQPMIKPLQQPNSLFNPLAQFFNPFGSA